MAVFLLRLRNLGYESAPMFVRVTASYSSEVISNTFCPDLLGDTQEKITLHDIKIPTFSGDNLKVSSLHIQDLIRKYLYEGDIASPTGGLVNGYQCVCVEGSAIHKNMVRLDEWKLVK